MVSAAVGECGPREKGLLEDVEALRMMESLEEAWVPSAATFHPTRVYRFHSAPFGSQGARPSANPCGRPGGLANLEPGGLRCVPGPVARARERPGRD